MNIDTKKLVWAKQRGSPYWPASVIDEPPSEIGERPKGSKCVLFFGTKNYGWIEPNSMVEYLPNREKFLNKYKLPGILKAAAQMDEFIANPAQNEIQNTAETDGMIRVKVEAKEVGEEPTFVYYNIGSEEPIKRKNLVSEFDLKRAKQQLETFSSGKKHSDLLHQNTETPSVKTEIASLQTKLMTLNEHIESVQSTISSLTKEFEDEGQVSTLNMEIESLKNELQQKKEMLVKQEEALKSMEIKIRSKELEIVALQNEKTEINAANMNIKNYSKELDELKQESLRSVETVKQGLNEQIISYDNELSVSKTEIDFLKRELKQTKEIIVKQEANNNLLKSQLSEMIKSQIQLSVEHQKERSALTHETDDVIGKLAAANLKIQNHSKLMDELKLEGLKSVEKVKQGLNEQITSYNNELTVSKTKSDLLEGEIQQTKEILVKEAQSSKSLGKDIRSKELEIATLKERVESFQSETQSLSAELSLQQNENKSLQATITKLNTNFDKVQFDLNVQSELRESIQKEIINLRKENNSLNARLAQVQTTTCNVPNKITPKKKSASKNPTDSNVFEVKQLLNHKKEDGQTYYLVRWKNYGRDDDTWESESALKCPKILRKYKKTHELN